MNKVFKYIIYSILIFILIRLAFNQEDYREYLSFLKPLLAPLFDLYLGFFKLPDTAFLLFFLICMACVGCLGWMFFSKYLPLKKSLSSLAVSLENVFVSHRGDPFSIKVENMDEVFRENTKFQTNWLDLRRDLFDYHSNKLERFHSSQYFNLNSLETKGFPFKIFSSIPGYFVGMGLIFTFLGLVAALYFTSAGMGSGSIEEARASLILLLRASTFKFLTSVAGISSSLLISVCLKLMYHNLHLKMSAVSEIIGEIFYNTPKVEVA